MNYDAIESAIRYLRPHSVKNFNKIRIGGTYDGGYVCIDDFNDVKIAISGGVAHDDRWENEMARDRNITTLAFDPTTPCDMKSVPILPYKLYASKLEAFPLTRNSTIDTLLESYEKYDAVGKIDIEGDEWELLTYTTDYNLSKFRQIVLEFHLNGTMQTLVDYGNVFEKLYKNFRVVHVHGNNWNVSHHFKNVVIPDVFEMTFVNVNLYSLEVSNEIFPTALDMPCNPDKEDLHLGTFSLQSA